MTRLLNLSRDERGTAVIEFAIALPILVSMIWGIFQLALLFEANAGIQNALGAGARYATIYDPSTSSHVPTVGDIKDKMEAALFGPPDGTYEVVEPSTPTGGAGYMVLEVKYTRAMNFLFFPGPTVTLDRTKQVYVVDPTNNTVACAEYAAGSPEAEACAAAG